MRKIRLQEAGSHAFHHPKQSPPSCRSHDSGQITVARATTVILRGLEQPDRERAFTLDGVAAIGGTGDQAGEGAELFSGRAAMAALERIRPESAPPTDPVFGGLGGRAIADRIRRAAQAAGLEGDFSGHSPRIGMARDLAASGASTTALGHVPSIGVDVRHPYQLLAGSLQEHLPC